MYALAYANMRFHGDGKSNLFNCSYPPYSLSKNDDKKLEKEVTQREHQQMLLFKKGKMN